MPSAPLRIVIAGGGTGGHLYPGIAVARAFIQRDPGTSVSFAGTAGGIETRVAPREGFPLDLIRSAGLKGKSPAAVAAGLAILPLSAFDAWSVISRRRPDLVIGVGGYSSGPVVLMASVRRVPTMVLEQNALPGFTNRLLARVVDAAAVTYDVTLPYFRERGFVSGNPVRPEFFEPEGKREVTDRSPGDGTRVLVFGGSRGAHAINLAMAAAAPILAASRDRLSIVHQTGDQDVSMVREAYGHAGLEARVEPFLFGMAAEMRAADLIICRAGATTLAELAAVGRPAVLVPFPAATDDHQRKNAEVLARAGAAELIDQADLDGAALAQSILRLARAPERRLELAGAIRRYATPDAAQRIVARAVALLRRPNTVDGAVDG